MAICDPLSYGKLAGKCQRVVPDEDASAFWKIVCAINRIAPVLPAIPEGAIRPSRSDPVVVFLERFLNMFQNRFGIGFRYLGPLRLWLTAAGDPARDSLEARSRVRLRCDSNLECLLPSSAQLLMSGTDYGSPAAYMKQLGFSG